MKRRNFLKFIGMMAVAPLSFLAPVEMIKAPLPEWSKGFYYTPYIPEVVAPPAMVATCTEELQRDIESVLFEDIEAALDE